MVLTRFGRKIIIRRKKSTEASAWQELDSNILWKILERVDPDDLFSSVCLVCQWWRSACWDALFWKDHETLDLTAIQALHYGGMVMHGYPQRLLNALQCVMNPRVMKDRLGVLKEIIVPRFIHLKKDHLILISQRSPKLRRIALHDSCLITASGLTSALKNWGELEELRFGSLSGNQVERVIKTIGKSCRNLSSLHISSLLESPYLHLRFGKKTSSAVLMSLRKIKVFGLKEAILYKKWVRTILLLCEELEELIITNCWRVRGAEDESCIGNTKGVSARIRKHKIEGSLRWSIKKTDALYTTTKVEKLLDLLWS